MPETATGVYLVSLNESPAKGTKTAACPLNRDALGQLLDVCPNLSLDGARPDRELLAERLSSFWLPDEGVLYIGLAGQPLRTRVRQYYRTPLGAPKPHRGGWWLKTLNCIAGLWVHFAPTTGFKDIEEDLLRAFAANVSPATQRRLPPGPIMPFANLRDGDWQRKLHGIKGATA